MRTPLVLTALALSSVALATPDLEVSGSCPGPMVLDISGLTPGGQMRLFIGSGPGSAVMPGGPCRDVATGLADLRVGPGGFDDGDGLYLLSPTLGLSACRRWVQVLDVSTCTLSEALPLSEGVGPSSCPGASAIANPSFESGIAPWTTSETSEIWTDRDAADGTYAVDMVDGSDYVEALIPAVSVASLTTATWQWKTADSGAISSVQWDYSDGTSDTHLYMSDDFAPAGDWVTADLLPFLDGSKSITRLRIYGFSGGDGTPDSVLIDDVQLCY
jgi:hypothetical protein